jgi:hypothetical protein
VGLREKQLGKYVGQGVLEWARGASAPNLWLKSLVANRYFVQPMGCPAIPSGLSADCVMSYWTGSIPSELNMIRYIMQTKSPSNL